MTRRSISAGAAVLGLLVIVLAVCSATVWRPSATASATLDPRPGEPYVLTAPGVLSLVDSDVTVTAEADGQSVTLAVGYSSDARAWLADDPYTLVTGMDGWTRLSAIDVTRRCPADDAAAAPVASPSPTPSAASGEEGAEASPSAEASASPSPDAEGCLPLTSSGADPAQADVWQLVRTEEGQVSLSLDAADPDLVVLAAAGGSAHAPTLTLTWPRRVATPWLVPGLAVGGVLVCLGVFGLLMDLQIRHADAARRRRAAERAARLAQADSTATLGIPAVSDPHRSLTRREMRDKERAEAAGEEWVDPRTGSLSDHAAGAGLDATAGSTSSAGGVAVPQVPEAPAEEPEEPDEPEDSPQPDQDRSRASRPDAGAPGAVRTRPAGVLPGLSPQRTQDHRSARQLQDAAPLVLASDEETSSGAAGGQERRTSQGTTDSKEQR